MSAAACTHSSSNAAAQPRRRALNLAIAATANVHGVPLLTYNAKDLQIIATEIDIRTP